ncbi:DUF1036 domain-containing protein [Hyphobacterium marinum]|uniref:DUF1036 domain-containing protein n=1 Tax=Hyphobacterium marinum TaxID=3116574 RepID=A0ABU7LX30_9PROT|nr:DUF1036 domain-containing protein [Hyphobacterium sp. Y6023]MEE2565832.1 DUF1036 domain-containing protein [Hyphobacterium sp. Y6023]
MIRVIAILAFWLLALPAARAAEICNETSYIVEAALGWRSNDEIAVEGWTRVRPGECVRAGPDIPAESGEPLLLYARSSAAYLGGVREWRGDIPLCVGPSDFSAEGVTDCEALGLEQRGFAILRGEHRQRTVLVEPAGFGDRAEEAGVQRLLQATGADIRAIDGVAGRRTTAAIAAFVRNAGLPRVPERPELIDALEAAALRRNATTGLTLCNETGEAAAAVIARQRNDAWESRGWWRLEPGACARVVAERLTTRAIHVYAELTEGNRPLSGGVEVFCVAPSRFLSEGRDQCAERGYAQAAFRQIPEPVEGSATLTFGPEDFDAEPAPIPELRDGGDEE